MKDLKALMHMAWVGFIMIVMLTVAIAPVIAQVVDNYSRKRDPNTQGLKNIVAEHTAQIATLQSEVDGLKGDSATLISNEIIRLTMLASEPDGSVEMIDLMGKEDGWPQTRIDAILAQIEEHQLRLEAMGFPRLVYVYIP